MVPDVRQRVSVVRHVVAKHVVGDRLRAVVHCQHGADVRMHHETAEGAQHEVKVVGLLAAASLRVRNGDNAVNVRTIGRQAAQPVFQRSSIAGRARRRTEDDDKIACADPAGGAARVAQKRPGFLVALHLRPRPETGLVQQVRGDLVGKIGFARQVEIDVAAAQSLKNAGVADVAPR